jgi:PAS domain S-box-containing protein
VSGASDGTLVIGRIGLRGASAARMGRRFWRRSHPLSWHLAGLCLALVLPILVLAGVMAGYYVSSERARLEQAALETARQAGVSIDRELEGLRAAVEVLSLSKSLQKGEFDVFDEKAREVRDRIGANVVLRDREGRQLINTRLPRGAELPVIRDFEPDRAALASGRTEISDLLMGAMARTPLFVVNVPVRLGDEVAYFLNLSMPPERIREVIARVHAPAEWVIGVIDRKGVRITRSAPHEAFVGVPIERPSWEAIRSGGEGILGIVRRTVEGRPVLVAHSRSDLSGWTVLVGVPTAQAVAPLHRTLIALAVLAVALLALAAALAFPFARRVSRPVMVLAAEAGRLGRGEAVQPFTSPVRELEAVGAALAEAGADRRAAEAALRESEARLRGTLATLNLGAFMARDLDGTVRHWSEGCARIFGWTEAEVVGRMAHDLLRTVFPVPRAEIEATLERDGEWVGDLRQTARDGPERVVTAHKVLQRGPDGRPVAVLEALTDVTTHRRAEAALAESRARLQELQQEFLHVSRLSEAGAMASALAHELNQPLAAATTAVGAAQMMLAEGDPAEDVGGALELAAEQTLRAGQIVRRLREFVARGGETERAIEDLPRLAREAGTLALVGARESGVAVSFRFAPDLPQVLVDRVQIQQVLFNLMRNAIQAVAERDHVAARGCEVEVSAVPALGAEAVEVSVADTGPGLAPEVAERLFEPFVSTKPDGMGVGLSICRTIVEAHGGRLWAEPRPGGGAVFRFTLPTAPPDAVQD